MAECGEPRHLDLFITIILNCSYYLGLTILTIMCLIGIYFVFTHCCWKPYSKRRQKRFLGISSRPSFVATIQFAFYNNLSTFQEIVVNRPAVADCAVFVCPTCGDQKEQFSKTLSDMDIYCPNCGTVLQLQNRH